MNKSLKDKVALLNYRQTDGAISSEDFETGMKEVMWVVSERYQHFLSRLMNDSGMFKVSDPQKVAEELVVKDLGYSMSQQEMDRYDQDIYMVSEEMGWYCKDCGNGCYWLYNGHWEAYVQGDDTEVCYYHRGHKENEHVKVGDWKQVSGSYMYKHCEYFFRRGCVSVDSFSDFEDDIAF